MSESSEFVYEGTEVLENLTEAVNYNKALVSLVLDKSYPGETLDFGAGIGTFSDLLKDDLNPKCLEIDKTQASVLKKKGLEVVAELTSSTYNYIYSLNVLEHIEEDKAAIEDLISALKPGGKLMIFVPAFNLLYSGFDKKVGHFRRYRKKSLRDLFDQGKVEIEELRYFDFIGFFFALIFKLLGLKADNINRRNVIIFDRLFFPLNKVFDPIFRGFLGKNVYVVVRKR